MFWIHCVTDFWLFFIRSIEVHLSPCNFSLWIFKFDLSIFKKETYPSLLNLVFVDVNVPPYTLSNGISIKLTWRAEILTVHATDYQSFGIVPSWLFTLWWWFASWWWEIHLQWVFSCHDVFLFNWITGIFYIRWFFIFVYSQNVQAFS